MTQTLSVVVPTFSNSRVAVSRIPLMRRLWISLLSQTDQCFEVVAVDNCSYDDTKGLFREYFPLGKFVTHDIPDHRAGARNSGAKASLGSHILFLDCDLIPYPHFIRNVRAFMASNPDDIAMALAMPYWKSLHLGREFISYEWGKEAIDYGLLEASVELANDWWGRNHSGNMMNLDASEIPPREHQAPEFWSTAFCVPRNVFFRLGGFDEDFHGWGHEDTMFGAVARAAGTRMYVLDNAIAIHQNHRPEEKDVTHFKDCANEEKNLDLFKKKMDKLGY